jgi:hypothetical protein
MRAAELSGLVEKRLYRGTEEFVILDEPDKYCVGNRQLFYFYFMHWHQHFL